MKKLLSLLAIMAVLFTAVACHNDDKPGKVSVSTIAWTDEGAVDKTSFDLELTNGYIFDGVSKNNDITSWFKKGNTTQTTGVFKVSSVDDGKKKITVSVTAPTTSIEPGKYSIIIPKDNLKVSDATDAENPSEDLTITDVITLNLGIASASNITTAISDTQTNWLNGKAITVGEGGIVLTGATLKTLDSTATSIELSSTDDTNDYSFVSSTSSSITVKAKKKSAETKPDAVTSEATLTITIGKDALTLAEGYKFVADKFKPTVKYTITTDPS